MTGIEMKVNMEGILENVKGIYELINDYRNLCLLVFKPCDGMYRESKDTLRECIAELEKILDEAKTSNEIVFDQDLTRDELIKNMTVVLEEMRKQEELLDQIHTLTSNLYGA